MSRNLDSGRVPSRGITAYLAAIALLAIAVPTTPSFAQASGQVRVKIVKAGLSVGGGAAVVGGINGTHFRNDKGVTMVLQGAEGGHGVRRQCQRDHDFNEVRLFAMTLYVIPPGAHGPA